MNSAKLIEAYILISGRVQGVGFRPFIYRLATRYKLKGYVINRGDAGVEVVLEGSEKNIKNLINAVKNESPSVSEINDVKIKYNPFRNRFNEFKIDKSKNDNNQLSGIFPPDIGICTECLKDMKNIHSRWYEYPFTACAWCGPRFTGIKSLPYDRERTHMDEFPLCEECITEYNDPLDRRFDAQGITCKKCGPEM
ncbi:acylphosphatase, partial [Candidatus Bathyarchaeota archaeon]|nr:acylphosphatase [Candidatus Bathyarchaeota archaeon]